MVLRGILAVVFAMAFTACASLSEPDGTNQTLVVGGVIVRYDSRTIIEGVQIELRDSRARTHTLSSGAGGLFYSTRIPPGVYRVDRIVFSGGLRALLWTNGPSIVIENGVVNNLGEINANVRWGMYWNANANQGYDQARDLFQQRHGSSSWNEMPWVNIGFNRENTPVAAPAEPAAQPPQVAEPVPPVIQVLPPPVEY